MSGKGWLHFYIWTGLATLAGLAFPGLVVIAALALILPGVAMAAAPGLLMYGMILHVCLFLTTGMRQPVRMALILGAVGVAAAGPVLVFNQREQALEARLKSGDSSVLLPAPQADSIAIIQNLADRSWYSRSGRSAEELKREAGIGCRDLCLRLLYNDGFKSVTVGFAPDALPDQPVRVTEAWRYRLERGATCSGKDYENIDTWQGEMRGNTPMPAQANIRARMAGGECVRSEPAQVSDSALTLLLISTPTALRRNQRPLELAPETLSAHRLELRRTSDASARPLFRRTFVTREPLAFPFALTYVSAGGMNVRPGLHFTTSYGTSFESNRAVFLELFGDRVRMPARGEDASRLPERILSALANQATAGGEIQQLVDAMIAGVATRPPASEAEARALVAALGDRRYASTFQLNFHMHAFSRMVDDAAPHIMRRMVDPPMTSPADPDDRVSSAANMVLLLSPEAVQTIGPQLLRMTEMPWTRGRAAVAVRRLGDLGTQGEQRLLQLARANPRSAGALMQEGEGALRLQAFVGLCLLRQRSAETVDLMRAALRDEITQNGNNGLHYIGRLSAEGLARAGLSAELAKMTPHANTQRFIDNIAANAARADGRRSDL
jgi:hypothetical protein